MVSDSGGSTPGVGAGRGREGAGEADGKVNGGSSTCADRLRGGSPLQGKGSGRRRSDGASGGSGKKFQGSPVDGLLVSRARPLPQQPKGLNSIRVSRLVPECLICWLIL